MATNHNVVLMAMVLAVVCFDAVSGARMWSKKTNTRSIDASMAGGITWLDCDRVQEEDQTGIGEDLETLLEGQSSISNAVDEWARRQRDHLRHRGGEYVHSQKSHRNLTISRFPWECARVQVPSSYEDMDGLKTTVFVRRARLKKRIDPVPQLWVLQGGPGMTGKSMKGHAEASWTERFDVYIPDHRGVPMSSALRCPHAQQAFLQAQGKEDAVCTDKLPCLTPQPMLNNATAMKGCFAELQERRQILSDFTVSNAARDVLQLMKLVSARSGDLSLYGVSYGSHWAQRILQIAEHEGASRGFPQIQRAILVGVVKVGTMSFDYFRHGANYAGRTLMMACGNSDTCAAHYGRGSAAFETLSKMLTDLVTGSNSRAQCGKSFMQAFLNTSDSLSASLNQPKVKHDVKQKKALLSMLLYLSLMSGREETLDFRMVVLAALHRLHRCKPRDKIAVATFQTILLERVLPMMVQALTDPKGMSLLLKEQIVKMELLPTEMPEVYRGESEESIIWMPRNDEKTQHDNWPKVLSDTYYTSPVNTSAEVLIMNGALDGQTPAWSARAAFESLEAKCKHLVILPTWGHGGVGKERCGGVILKALMQTPADSDTCAAVAEAQRANKYCQPDELDFDNFGQVGSIFLPGLWDAEDDTRNDQLVNKVGKAAVQQSVRDGD